MKKLLLSTLIFLLIHFSSVFAQNYNISNSTVSTCSGNFFDSGGSGGNYANNENYVMTFCSNVPGECVRVSFSAFELEDGFDFLTVYNGSNTGAPVLGTYTGTTIPGMLTSTTGCLTFEFTSDNSQRRPGFEAILSCVPCPGSACPSCNGGAAPANDACSGAMNLGALPAPAACPNGVGAWANFNTTNICATAENPYTTLSGCQPSGNMASPATDVWYRFTITGPTLNIQIAGMQTPNIGLYAGNNCNNLTGRGCAIGGGGILNTSFGGLAPGTYYLQVSGGNLNDQCAFTLSLQNNFDCQGCVIQSSFTAVPPPTNGTYTAGQTVTFCYTVTNYNQTSINWLHGIVPSFGAGWDMSTLVTNPPVSCSGQGTWSWYNTNVTSTSTGNVTGPGFYFESALGNVGGVTDGNPGNNFGDNNPNNLCDWTFCWTITTLPPSACIQGASLNITVDTYGDGESGSWTSLACTGDPVADFFATLTCCVPPSVAVTDPLCFGQNTGSATGTGQGNAPWDYIWKNNAGATIQTANNVNGSNTINNLAAGNYSLTCVDNTGCTSVTNFTITAPTQIVVNTVPVAASCNGLSDGSATVSAVGGAGGYTYLWAPSANTGTIETLLAAGTYTVTVTDANGCTGSTTAVITQPGVINVNTSSVNANCGANNGSVTVNANGGVGALQYSINGGTSFQASNIFPGLGSGNYNVVVQDANGCQGTAIAQVNNSQAPVINSAPFTNVNCNGGNNGTITINASGGTGALQYSINNGTSFVAGNVFNGLASGNYSIIVEDANGCQATLNVTITEPPLLVLNLTGVDPICGNANGTITATAVGGSGALQYSINGGAFQAATTFSSLAPGNYTVTVRDANNCTMNAAIVLTTAPPLVIAGVPVASTCGNANGSITVNANGGTTNYDYSINGGALQSTTAFNNLSAGNYTVMVTDANGCTATAAVAVTDQPGPTIVSAIPTEVTCFGGSNGVITVTTAGGTAPLQYSLNGGPFQSTAVFDTLYSGNYSILIQDANGCTDVINVTVSEPTAVLAPWNGQNSTCGFSNGSVTVTASGGTGTLMYSLNGGPFQLSNTFNNLPAGNYDITVQDASGCIVVAQTSVSNVPGPVIPNLTLTMVTCNGGNDGSVVINTIGGTLPFQYSINNGSTFQSGNTFNNLPAGNLVILVTDSNGCTVATNDVITEPSLIVSNEIITGSTCSNSNGSVTINAAGGTGALQYSLSGAPFQATGTYSGLSAGNYSFEVQDANHCIVTGNFVIPDAPGPIVTSTTFTEPLCNGGTDGSITITTNSGTNPLQFTYPGGPTLASGNFTSVAAGTYDITVTDANGCTATTQVTVTEPTPVAVNINITGSTCGYANGSIAAAGNGGSGVMQYNVDGGAFQASGNFNSMLAGNYTVIVQDANGCSLSTPVVIPDAPAPTISNIPIVNLICNGGTTGEISVITAGGTGALTYTLNGGSSQVNNTFTNLSAGAYTVVVTDANGCTVSGNVNLTEPTLLVVAPAETPSTCSNSNGIITITANGATPAYQYSLNGGAFQVSNVFNGLAAGNYSVTVEDANGCQTTEPITVTDLPSPVVSNVAVVDAACYDSDDGSVTVSVNGGTAPLTYSMNGGPSQPNGIFNNLVDGNYTVIVTDANGCTATANAVVNEPTEITLVAIPTPSTCGFANGSVLMNGAGGTGALTYSLNAGPFQASNIFNNLLAGNYNVTIHDANGCELKTNIAIPDLPGPVITSAPVTDALCFGSADGTIIINTTSGTAPLSFSIDNSATTQASNNFNNLIAGNYDIVVTDANGCTAILSVTINEPTLLTGNAVTASSTCSNSNGSVTVTEAGGTPAYQFSLNSGASQPSGVFSGLLAGNYDVVIIDDHSCSVTVNFTIADEPSPTLTANNLINVSCFNGNDGELTVGIAGGTAPINFALNGGANQLSPTFSGLTAGNYTVLVTDANGCTVQTNEVITEPTILAATYTTTNSTCSANNGTVTINASGATPGYTFQLDSNPVQPDSVFQNLLAGNYTITITDLMNCQLQLPITLIDEPSPVISAVAVTPVTCNSGTDGTITITSNGGTGTINYSIDNGTSSTTGNIFSTLVAGTYDIVITDANGCTAIDQAIITEPAAITSNVGTTSASCGNSDGTITAAANGGTSPYQYSIDNGITNQPNGNFSGLLAGNYMVLVTDANGCTENFAAAISNTAAPAITSAPVTDLTCYNSGNGTLTINANGGTAPLNYSIDNGSTFQLINSYTNLPAGNYQLVVEDALGCQANFAATITEPTLLTMNTAQVNTTCSSSNGSITITAAGGTTAYNYSIDGGTTNQLSDVFAGIVAGNYVALVTDANGCTSQANVIIIDAPGPGIPSANGTDANCNGSNDGSITVVANNGTAPLTFSIDNGVTTQNTGIFNNLSPANYTVLITDANGCTISTSIIINEPSAIVINSNSTPASCGNSDGTLTIIAVGGTGTLEFSIDNGITFQSSATFNNLIAATYDVVVKDANGCTSATNGTVNNAAAPVITNSISTDITCFGSDNGTITINANGGTGVLQYSNDNGATYQATGTFSNLAPGTYNIIVEDVNGCQATTSLTIVEPTAITASASLINTTCSAANGSLQISAAGGTGNLSYSINNGVSFQASNNFNNLLAGNYTIIIEDDNGCQLSINEIIQDAPAAVISNIAITDLTCNGSDDGTLLVTANGGTAPLLYSIDNGVTTQSGNTFGSLTPGNYTILVTDSNGCTVTSPATIIEPAAITAAYSSTNASCGNADGTLTINAIGGSGTLYFSIDNGASFQTTSTFSFLTAGSYTIIIKDVNGCEISLPTAVNNNAAPSIQSNPFTNITCNGAGDGTITINASGGIGILLYSIDNGVTTQNNGIFTNLTSGIYNIEVTDVNGCSATSTVTITEPQLLTASAATVTSTCSQNNGSLTISTNGGTPGYQFSINGGTTFGNNATFNNLTSQAYNITVQDANGCSYSFISNVPSAPGPSIAAVFTNNISCNGYSDGIITISANGGSAPLQYSIDNGITFSSGIVFDSLGAGNYQVVIMDANGCTSTSAGIITQPIAITYAINVVNANCGNSDGSLQITANGGSGSFTYSIDNGTTFQPGNSFSSLPAGTYQIIVRDASDCINSGTATILNNSAPAIQNTTVTNNSCNGSDDASITIAAAGGAAPLAYSIDGGFTWHSNNIFNGLTPGNYSIIVSDTTGCTATGSVTLTEPNAIVATYTTLPATCSNSDGSVTLSASGGSGALSYSLNGGPSQTGLTFSNLAAGNYNIVITDATGCSHTLVTSVSNLNAPLINSITSNDISCYGGSNGSISIGATGGTGILQFSINNGQNFVAASVFNNLSAGTYSIVIIDANNCVSTGNITLNQPDQLVLNSLEIPATCGNANGQIQTLVTGGTLPVQYSINNGTTYQNQSVFNNLAQGSYQILITDAEGCTTNTSQSVTNIAGPLVAALPITNSLCNGSDDGSATINLNGGTGPYQYVLNNGIVTQQNNFFSPLAPGNYTIEITDANGCDTDSSFAISEPTPVTLSFTVTNATCSASNASLQLSGIGGTGSLTYSNNNGLSFQSSSSFQNLQAGNYTLIAVDSNGCTASQNAIITDAPAPVLQTVSSTDVSCNSLDNGTLTANITGGTAPMLYSIDNGINLQTSPTFNNLAPGIYTVYITDVNGCSTNGTTLISEPAAMITSTSSIAALCFGTATGTASITVNGGIAPYSYNWPAPGSNASTATNLSTGNYLIMVTDSNGCTITDSVFVDQPDAITMNSTLQNISCNGLSDGSIQIIPAGGTAPFNYNWSSPAISGTGNFGIAAGAYAVTITDANGCTGVQNFTITEPAALSLGTSSTPAGCFGTSTGTVTTSISGGTAPYSYLWSNNAITSDLSAIPAGTYTVTVSDANGCTEVLSQVVTEPDELITSSSVTNVTCNGSSNGTASVTVTGGTIPYTYLWNNGVSTSGISGVNGGNYQVTVTDVNNCQSVTTALITEPAAITVNVSGTSTICIGQSTLVSATAQGGNGGYTYLWSNGVTGSSQLVNPTLTAGFSVAVTDSMGCIGASVPVTITVNPPLAITISLNDTICEGETTSISAVATGGNGGPYAFSWNSLSDITAQVNVSPISTTSYVVTVNDGCGTPAVNAATTILVNPLPVVDFTPVPASGCAPLIVLFDNNTTSVTNGTSFTWYFGDGFNSNDIEPSHTYTEPGFYTVILKAVSSEGCINELVQNDVIEVFPVPDANLAVSPMVGSILYPYINFTDLSHGATIWNWDFGDGSAFGTEANMQHTYEQTGNYPITLYVMNDYGCSDTAYSEVIIEGASTVYIPNAFTPNGDGKNDTFSVYGIGLNDADLVIFNRWGNAVFRTSNLNEAWDGKDHFSGGDCPVDVYIYNVKVKNFKGETQEFTGRVTLLN